MYKNELARCRNTTIVNKKSSLVHNLYANLEPLSRVGWMCWLIDGVCEWPPRKPLNLMFHELILTLKGHGVTVSRTLYHGVLTDQTGHICFLEPFPGIQYLEEIYSASTSKYRQPQHKQLSPHFKKLSSSLVEICLFPQTSP